MNATVTSPIPGFKVALTGEYGSGKTTAIRTLVEAGLEVFCIFTEDSRGLLNDLPSSKLHWMYIPPADTDWDTMNDAMRKANTLSQDALMKMPDPNRQRYNQLMSVVDACKNFKCERTDQAFGDVTEWNTDRVLFVDSMTGLNAMSMDLIVGSKLIKAQADWQMAQTNLERLIRRWCTGLYCHFVLTAHVEREADEVSGGIKLMIATLGRKLAPQLPRNFDEVIFLRRAGQGAATFVWSNTEPNIALKNRYLPMSDKLAPSFVPLLNEWKKKGGVVAPTVAK